MAAGSAPAPLTVAQQRRGLLTLFATTFFAWAGFLLVIPLVAVHYVDGLGWAAGTVGLVLAVRQFAQQGLAIPFGMLADRIGPKSLMALGMLLRGVGFAAVGVAPTLTTVLLAMLVAALGGALFDSPSSAALASIVPPDERARTYSLLGVVSGIGMVAGTQLGAFLIRFDFRAVCFTAAAGYGLIAAIVAVALPRIRISSGRLDPRAGLGQALRDRTFLRYVVLMTGFWFAWTQLQLTLTLAATDIIGSTDAVAWIYLVNTGIVIGLGFVLPRLLLRWCKPIEMLALGTLLLGAGLGLIAFAHDAVMILAAAGVFSVGMVLAKPGQETVTANLSDPAVRGTYFGVAMLSLAFGGGFGNLLGGVIYDFGVRHEMQAVTWGTFFAIAALSAAGLWLNRRSFGAVRTEAVIVETRAYDNGAMPERAPVSVVAGE
jgi:DHA1 family multidrug resistance protein-like MFS transporter